MTLKALGEIFGPDLMELCPKPQMGNIYELILCSVKAGAAAEHFYRLIQ